VIADKDPSKGQAIIGENAIAAKLYAVGGAIPGGAHLHAVYSDRVLIERNGVLEALKFPRTPQTGSAFGPSPPVTRNNVAAAAAANPTLLAGLVRIQPVFAQGKLTGYRIFPGGAKGTTAFTQLGLKPGDLIEAVNGTPLDDATRAMEVLQTLGSAASATVTVSRNGQSQEVNLNLSTLNVEGDAGDSGAPAPTQDASQPGTQPSPPAVPGPGRVRGSGPANLGAAPGNTPPPGGTISTGTPGADAPIPGDRER